MRNDRGSITIHVGLALIAILMFAGMVIDQGVMYVARRQTQNAADAAALAGALTLAESRTSTGDATVAARAFANANAIWAQSAGDANIDVTVPVLCPDKTNSCIRVDVMRGLPGRFGGHGNTIPTYLVRLAGPTAQGTRATATAQVATANQSQCLKPWLIPDKWRELGGGATKFDPGIDLYIPPTPANGATTTGYTLATDYGASVTLKPNNGSNIGPSDFYEINNASDYQDSITNCRITAAIGDAIDVLPGNRVGPTMHGTQDLIDKDPGAYWDGTKVVGSAYAISPRIVAVGLFDLNEFYNGQNRTGNFQLHIVNILSFFVTGVAGGSKVTGVLVTNPALSIATGGTVADEAAWLTITRLVK